MAAEANFVVAELALVDTGGVDIGHNIAKSANWTLSLPDLVLKLEVLEQCRGVTISNSKSIALTLPRWAAYEYKDTEIIDVNG